MAIWHGLVQEASYISSGCSGTSPTGWRVVFDASMAAAFASSITSAFAFVFAVLMRMICDQRQDSRHHKRYEGKEVDSHNHTGVSVSHYRDYRLLTFFQYSNTAQNVIESVVYCAQFMLLAYGMIR